jgi:gamma-glutamylcyclotransferase
MPNFHGTLYFGYGSNLWQNQVARRCPNAKFVGIARLRHWRWQINERGYANVVEAPQVPHDPSLTRWLGPLMDPEDQDLRQDNLRTYGLVYELNDDDVKRMDRFEGVPHCYSKEEHVVELWLRREGTTKTNILRRGKRVKALVYCDRVNTTDSDVIYQSYVYRMNQGILDALEEGVPASYIDQCIRPFIPLVDDPEDPYIKEAIQHAMMMGVDVKKVAKQVEDEMAVAPPTSGTNVPVITQSLQDYLRSHMPNANGPSGLKDPPRRRALSSRW